MPTASLNAGPDDAPCVAAADVVDGVDLARLFDTHAAAVARCAERLLGAGPHVEDIVQDVFLVAWRRRSEVVRHPRAWLLAVCLHRVQHHIRSRVRRRGLLERLLSRRVDPEPLSASVLVERHEHRERLRAALFRLDDDVRAVFVLYELEERTGREIAEVLGIKEKTMWSRLQRARRILAEELA